MEIDRRRYDAHDPVTKGTPQISEDDSDEAPLHAIIREETERQSEREPGTAERNGAGGGTRPDHDE